jgi:mono/diheme cytochrome c family protein
MRKGILPTVAAVWLSSIALAIPEAAAPQNRPVPPVAGVPTVRETVDRYCVGCHNQRLQTGALALDTLDAGNVGAHAEVWEKVVRRLRGRVMPPLGARRPDEATYQALVETLEASLDRGAAAHPAPGAPVVHRLNRAEYANAIRDLLALDVDTSALLPADDSAYGFDNVSDVLNLSPSLQERYLSAARKISALAVGDSRITPSESTYRVRQDRSQNQHVEGLSLGTIGGTLVRHTFPLDGEYLFQTTFMRTNLGMMRGLEYPHRVEYTIDGERVHLATIGGNADLAAAFEKPTATGDAMEARLRVRLPVTAGPHAIGVAFVEDLPVVDTVRLQPFLRSSYNTLDWTGRPHIEVFSMSGPFNASGPGDTPSRRRIFSCRPTSRQAETACARRILLPLARRAYRRPPTPTDLDHVLTFYDAGRREGSFETGIQAALQFILASPNFVFRIERDPDQVAVGAPYRLGDVELASRLSFFLWSSIPDDELLDAAIGGRLKDPAVRERQVRRMLADPRSRSLVSNFAGQWLQLRNVRSVLPNSEVFPDFDDNLREAFLRETELLFESVIGEDRNVLDLLRADYTFVNERLARHYGIPNIYGSQFRRVAITAEARKGLLGHGSILAITSHAERTSPVLRGKWILENLLGTPPPPPPADVPALEDKSEKARTVRERLEQHRASPVCASCHQVMDPLGFALENFDAVGAWRTEDEGARIDASGQLADGAPIDGVVAMREALLSRPELFVSTMTEKLLTYSLGRGVDHHDMPAVRAIVRRAAHDDYRFSSLVLGVVESVPFLMRTKPPQDSAKTTINAEVAEHAEKRDSKGNTLGAQRSLR